MAYSIHDSTRKIVMGYGKFYVMHDMMLSTGRSYLPVIWSQIKPLLVHRTVGIVLAYLNCHVYSLFVVAFTPVGQLALGSDLFVCQ